MSCSIIITSTSSKALQQYNMTELELWLKNADANSFFDGLTAIEAKTLKDYLHGKLSPKKAASDFVQNFDLETIRNPSFQGHLEYLSAIAYDISDPRGQMKVVKLVVAIRNLRYGMNKGWHSKREMDLRKTTDLHSVLAEFAESLADDQDSNYFYPWILPSEVIHADNEF